MQGSNSSSLPQTYLWCYRLARGARRRCLARLDEMQWAAVSREVEHGRLRLFALDRRQRGGEVQLLVDGLAGRRRVQHPNVHAFAERLQGRIVELHALTIEFGEQLAHATTEIAGGQRLADFLCNVCLFC